MIQPSREVEIVKATAHFHPDQVVLTFQNDDLDLNLSG